MTAVDVFGGAARRPGRWPSFERLPATAIEAHAGAASEVGGLACCLTAIHVCDGAVRESGGVVARPRCQKGGGAVREVGGLGRGVTTVHVRGGAVREVGGLGRGVTTVDVRGGAVREVGGLGRGVTAFQVCGATVSALGAVVA
jgi:hypothetical protein